MPLPSPLAPLPSPKRARLLLLCAILAALTFAAYWPVLRNDFVQFDDAQYITANHHVTTGLSWANAKWAFTTGYQGNWHPLTWLSHQLDVQLFGLRPRSHHLENLLFHIANTLLLFLVLRKMIEAGDESPTRSQFLPLLGPSPRPSDGRGVRGEGNPVIHPPSQSYGAAGESTRLRGATARQANPLIHQSTNPPAQPSNPPQAAWLCFFVAALFAVHPLHVESVAWAAERKDVLSTFFFLLTLWAYTAYVRKSEPALSEKSEIRNPNPAPSNSTSRQEQQRRARAGERRPKSEIRTKAESKLAEPEFSESSNLQPSTFNFQPWHFYALALFWFTLGLMSKPMLVTTPFVLLLLDFWPLGRFTTQQSDQPLIPKSNNPSIHQSTNPQIRPFSVLHSSFFILEKVPFLVLCVASSVITFLVQQNWHAASTVEGLPLEPRITNAVLSYMKYIGKMVWPTNLAVFYPHPGIKGPAGEPPEWQVSLALLFLVGLSVSIFVRRKREPWLTTGWFWFLGTLVPVIGIVQVGGQAIADRYMYIPSIGLLIMFVWWAADVFGNSRSRRVGLATIGVAALAACSVTTERQTRYWSNNLALFEHAIAATQDNAVAHYMVAMEYLNRGKNDLAMDHLKKTLEADPNLFDALIIVGFTDLKEGKLEEAVETYEHALKVKPWDAQTHNRLGVALWRLGRTQEAIEHYAEALRIEPENAEEHFNMGLVLASQGSHKDAATHFRDAVRLNPHDFDAQRQLVHEDLLLRNLPEAETFCRETVRLAPKDAETRVTLAEVLGMSGKTDEAVAQLTEALRLKPEDATARKDMGTALLEQGKFAEAGTNFAEAVRLKPDYTPARTGLGRALAAQGRLAEAQAQFREVARLCPNNADALVTLGDALMAGGKTNEAAPFFASALKLDPDLADKNIQAAKALLAQGHAQTALARFVTAASLSPNDPEAHENLGLALMQLGRLDPAAHEFEETLRLRQAAINPSSINPLVQQSSNPLIHQSINPPPLAGAFYELATVRVMQGKPKDAVANYHHALSFDTNYVAALNDLAWLLATDPHDDARDGAEAVRLAERARDLSGGKEARFWGTLDAAYAEAGRWDDAVQAAQKTADLAQAAGQKELADAARHRLALYAQHKPFRQ